MVVLGFCLVFILKLEDCAMMTAKMPIAVTTKTHTCGPLFVITSRFIRSNDATKKNEMKRTGSWVRHLTDTVSCKDLRDSSSDLRLVICIQSLSILVKGLNITQTLLAILDQVQRPQGSSVHPMRTLAKGSKVINHSSNVEWSLFFRFNLLDRRSTVTRLLFVCLPQ